MIALQVLGSRWFSAGELVAIVAEMVRHHLLAQLQLPRLETLPERAHGRVGDLVPGARVPCLALRQHGVGELLRAQHRIVERFAE
ncbi:MAG: hypothetical protein GEV06_28985, partial [Luteitalea sp.]|nr:hypothetical protein [Luteitalea sp.]